MAKKFCYGYLSLGKWRKKIHVEHVLIWNILFWVSELEIIFYWSARPGHKMFSFLTLNIVTVKLAVTANQ